MIRSGEEYTIELVDILPHVTSEKYTVDNACALMIWSIIKIVCTQFNQRGETSAGEERVTLPSGTLRPIPKEIFRRSRSLRIDVAHARQFHPRCQDVNAERAGARLRIYNGTYYRDAPHIELGHLA